ncbi:MAG: hypothetical protein UU73_C0002G0176 [Candidatus Daviesbacteria bacterium GW2011_GWA1_41_61]|uniref:Fimbrial assembly family protein n=1 Tax=Candidatus Daviesbacteria bacterium GW2011_GWA2_40_9 TaxID=1618424 RepID=A0A0G0U2Y2_9BACT|nr:MAG: hypothetical protein UU26_C0009G0025 [Candidatus Daviesbacteria bacterium GW2011_GWC1_40_9]KKR83454.1 MAG: hypothetical protein UU29_C0005G0035 [Candidatus Daviesbacteria bacterium GW2011_GWA2_40_9]KKR93836.1 MAG: hypothetical protein UU44_C0001G0176 [Candidatus Daviesbacteria bacterium GW2011_GWB1_41_15]KKS15302.1 MAG: hypothetical protein UU73_C0002G0176 [Candidatus Daviesbacteria bacterium GW2011_GWA1_41_61]
MAASKNPGQNLYRINLLVRKGEPVAILVALLKWILSSGRFIVILVELIVIGALVYRYQLDTELDDLKDKINQEIPYLKSLRNDEIMIRQTQFQLATIKKIKAESPNYSAVITKVGSLMPLNSRLTSIALEQTQPHPKTSFTINGQAPIQTNELSAFIRALKKDPAFSEVTLTNVAFENEIKFSISGSLPRGGIN